MASVCRYCVRPVRKTAVCLWGISYLELRTQPWLLYMKPPYRYMIQQGQGHGASSQASLFSITPHTVVWECCKDNQQSQWEMPYFGVMPASKPLGRFSNKLHSWLYVVDPTHMGVSRFKGACLRMREIFTLRRLFFRATAYMLSAHMLSQFRPSVCPSVCPSHGWISQKRLKLGSCNFHHTVAPSI